MTQTEFNDKYRDYIETQDGVPFSGLCFNNSNVIEFLDDIFENALTRIPGFKFSQIKIKFAYCRFYSNLKCDGLISIIERKVSELINL